MRSQPSRARKPGIIHKTGRTSRRFTRNTLIYIGVEGWAWMPGDIVRPDVRSSTFRPSTFHMTAVTDPEELQQRVLRVVAAALDRNPSEIQPAHSLIDDLGAESIDFLDIRFRIETEFSIKVTDEDLWGGNLRAENPGAISENGITAEGMRLLKQNMPDFRWERFPHGVSKGDLPRLITIQTIVDYLTRRFEA